MSKIVKKLNYYIISNHLYTAGQPPVDLLIRTSGEYRLSNFMLWQGAYSELWFSNCLWPDFTKKDLQKKLFKKPDEVVGISEFCKNIVDFDNECGHFFTKNNCEMLKYIIEQIK